MIDTKRLMRGDMVVAIRHLDPSGADVRPGTIGVVFEETNAYGDGGGPMVRWMNMGACNVYDGDVRPTKNRRFPDISIIDPRTQQPPERQ